MHLTGQLATCWAGWSSVNLQMCRKENNKLERRSWDGGAENIGKKKDTGCRYSEVRCIKGLKKKEILNVLCVSLRTEHTNSMELKIQNHPEQMSKTEKTAENVTANEL